MTIRQKRRARIIGKNGTVEGELLEAGYASTTARKQPKSVMKAKGWTQLLEEKLPDEKLLSVHDELLDSKTDQIRLGAVGLGYKVKGKLAPENVANTQINIGDKGNTITFVNFKNDTES